MEPLNERRNLERFGELVLADHELHDQLRGAVDETAFVALAIRLGAERGCDFTSSVVRDVLHEKRRDWLERWL